jgi:hypothetical protein
LVVRLRQGKSFEAAGAQKIFTGATLKPTTTIHPIDLHVQLILGIHYASQNLFLKYWDGGMMEGKIALRLKWRKGSHLIRNTTPPPMANLTAVASILHFQVQSVLVSEYR